MASADALAAMLDRIRHVFTVRKQQGQCRFCGLTTVFPVTRPQ
jgi:hypothetical protein